MFYRGGMNISYAVMAGNAQFKACQNLHFSGEDIDYLRSLSIFEEGFLESLRDFRFEGDIDIMPEAPQCYEGLVRVEGPLSQAQLIETTMLNLIQASDPDRHQGQPGSPGRPGDKVMEFGLRRLEAGRA